MARGGRGRPSWPRLSDSAVPRVPEGACHHAVLTRGSQGAPDPLFPTIGAGIPGPRTTFGAVRGRCSPTVGSRTPGTLTGHTANLRGPFRESRISSVEPVEAKLALHNHMAGKRLGWPGCGELPTPGSYRGLNELLGRTE